MTYRSFDLETTGLPSDEEGAAPTGIMQIGWTDYTPGEPIGEPTAHFVNCGIKCSIEARAVHHITDRQVEGGISPSEACALLAGGRHEALCAHNIDHEKHYVGPGINPETDEERAWLCTYKTALRLWPEAPGHKLHELRYFLDLDSANDFDPRLCATPHLAPDDSYVGAHLLRRVLQEAEAQDIDVKRLIKWSSGPALLYTCFLKKHKGTPWSKVPTDYLDWIVNKSDIKDRDIRATAKFYLKRNSSGGT